VVYQKKSLTGSKIQAADWRDEALPRSGTSRAASSAKSHGVIYHALQVVVVAIDGAAHVITGSLIIFPRAALGPASRSGAGRAPGRLRAWRGGIVGDPRCRK